MTEHPFATLIRKLDAGAIPAPWEVYESDSGEWALVHRRASGMVRPVADFPGSGESGSEASDASVDLTEMLRNAAPEVAALVEAASVALASWHVEMRENDSPGLARLMLDMTKVSAALDALAAKAKEVES